MVLGFGAVTIDDIIYVDRPLSAGKGKVTARLTEHGGNVATALVAVARLGGRAGFVGWLNDGTLDDPSAADFEREGVDISLAPRRTDAQAIRAIVTVAPDGERFIAYDDEVPHGTSATLPDDALSRGRVLLIDGYGTPAPRGRRAGARAGAGGGGRHRVVDRTRNRRADVVGRSPGVADRIRAGLYRGERRRGDAVRALVGRPGRSGADRRRAGELHAAEGRRGAVAYPGPQGAGGRHDRSRRLLSRRLCLGAERREGAARRRAASRRPPRGSQ